MYKSSLLFVKFIQGLRGIMGKSVLDMGCGSGAVSIIAASLGAECVAADKNPASVKCTTENAVNNGLSTSIKAVQSDLFENLDEGTKFDLIFFNPPFYDKEPLNEFEMGFNAGKDYRVLREFASESGKYLNENGEIYLIISSDLEFRFIENLFIENGFCFNLLQIDRRFFETFYIVKAFIKLQLSI